MIPNYTKCLQFVVQPYDSCSINVFVPPRWTLSCSRTLLQGVIELCSITVAPYLTTYYLLDLYMLTTIN